MILSIESTNLGLVAVCGLQLALLMAGVRCCLDGDVQTQLRSIEVLELLASWTVSRSERIKGARSAPEDSSIYIYIYISKGFRHSTDLLLTIVVSSVDFFSVCILEVHARWIAQQV